MAAAPTAIGGATSQSDGRRPFGADDALAAASVRRGHGARLAQVLARVYSLEREVLREHLVDKVVETYLRFPPQALGRLRSITPQLIDLCRAEVGLVDHRVLVKIEAGHRERCLGELANRPHHACRDDV